LAALNARYDLVLAFDYENLHTKIEENAALLLQRLTAVGLGSGHGKRLDVIAHSMGGLVARAMIEKAGGQGAVHRLVTAGTPHHGSPWPTIQDWATTALTFGLNALAGAFWPAGVVGALVAATERVDNALDQMRPDSPFVAELHQLPDPNVPYTVLVGDRSLVAPAASTGAVQRLLAKLSVMKVVDAAVAAAFLGDPNDMAVSVESARWLPPLRHPEPDVRVLPCDHMTFFSSPAAATELRNVLTP
jgi:triacylglycerol esterase/lipase EstA (alpha/beta hydrolase family)